MEIKAIKKVVVKIPYWWRLNPTSEDYVITFDELEVKEILDEIALFLLKTSPMLFEAQQPPGQEEIDNFNLLYYMGVKPEFKHLVPRKEVTVTEEEKEYWNSKQDPLNFAPESVGNKRTTWSLVTTHTSYPSEKLVKDSLDAKQNALGFTPENVANKRTSWQATPTDTAYPSEKLVKDSLDNIVNSSYKTPFGGYTQNGGIYFETTSYNQQVNAVVVNMFPISNNRPIVNFGTNKVISYNSSNQITYGSAFSGVTTYVNGVQTNVVTLGKWNTVVCVFNQITADTLQVGRSGSNNFGGIMGTVRIYNRAIAQNEALRLWNNGNPEAVLLDYKDNEASNTELVQNNTFDTNTWWTTTGVVIEDGVAKFNNLGDGAGILQRGGLLRIGKTYELKFEIKNYVSGRIYIPALEVISTNAETVDTIGVNFRSNGEKTLVFVAESRRLYFVCFNHLGNPTTLEIDNVYCKQIGCINEYLSSNIGRYGVIDTASRQHLQIPTLNTSFYDTLATSNLFYRDIKTAITGNTTLSEIIPPRYRIDSIIINNTTSNSVTINVGTFSGDNSVVNAKVCPAGITVLNDAEILRKFFSSTGNSSLFISSSNWNSASIDFDIIMRRAL